MLARAKVRAATASARNAGCVRLAERNGTGTRRKKDLHAASLDVAEVRAAVVVVQHLAVGASVTREAVGAVRAHPDTVAEAVPADHPVPAVRRSRCQRNR